MIEEPRFSRRLLDGQTPSADLCQHPGDSSYHLHRCVSVVFSGLQRRGVCSAFELFSLLAAVALFWLFSRQEVVNHPQCPRRLQAHSHLKLIPPLYRWPKPFPESESPSPAAASLSVGDSLFCVSSDRGPLYLGGLRSCKASAGLSKWIQTDLQSLRNSGPSVGSCGGATVRCSRS